MNFTFGEVSERLGVSKDTIRYYENEGLLPDIERDKNRHRIFSESDVDWIFLICSLRNTDMSIRTIKEYISLLKNNEPIEMRRELLLKHREHIEAKIAVYGNMKKLIDKKLDYYKETLKDDSARCLDFEEEWKSFREGLKLI